MNKKIVIKRFRINEVTLIAFLVSSILLFPAPTAWADSETFESQGEVRIPETPVPGNGEIDKEIGCLALPPAKCPQGSDDKPLKCLGTACQKETDDLPIQPVEDSQDQQKRDDRRKTSREERKETEETEQTSYPTRHKGPYRRFLLQTAR